MRKDDKPFVCYRHDWGMRIVPRSAAGWLASGLWMASLGLLVAVLVAVLATKPGPPWGIVAVAAFLAATALWAVAMIRWMLSRSEIIRLDELLDLERKRDRQEQWRDRKHR